MTCSSGADTAKPVGLQRAICRRWRRGGAALAFIVGLLVAGGALGDEPSRPSREQLKLGLDLFTHEWEPSDPLCHDGDGLGPVYNETSCVACHGQGGVGGAGPAGMNVEVLTSIGTELGAGSLHIPGAARISRFEDGDSKVEIRFDSSGSPLRPFTPEESRLLSIGGTAKTINVHFSKDPAFGWFRHGFVITAKGTTLRTQEFDVRINLTELSGAADIISAANVVSGRVIDKTTDARGFYNLSCAEGSISASSFTLKPDEDALRMIHPALVDTPSTVLHHFGVDPRYAKWRSHLRARLPAPRSRNTTQLALAGGSIVASQRNSPPLFGLGLIEALPDQVLLATAAEEPAPVRGRANTMKSGRIGKFGWKAQTTSLREFVLGACASELGLEVPGHRQAISPLAPDVKATALDLTQGECDALVAYVRSLPAPVRLESPHPDASEAGRASFLSIGCADCHRPSLGNIEGIYSDLLMHDMGPDLVSVTMDIYYQGTQVVDFPTAASLADGSEWRTPPLWGYRDSGPYLHDGRAENLSEAVKFHKGQARDSAARFGSLSSRQRSEIEEFLNSLAAPPSAKSELEADRGNRDPVLGPSSRSPTTGRTGQSVRRDAKTRAHQERLAASRLKLAESLEKMDKPAGALVFYHEIVRDEPDTAAARIAAARIEALAGRDGDRKDASARNPR
jgi:Di-haem oxidoreductase, putative peroxidase